MKTWEGRRQASGLVVHIGSRTSLRHHRHLVIELHWDGSTISLQFGIWFFWVMFFCAWFAACKLLYDPTMEEVEELELIRRRKMKSRGVTVEAWHLLAAMELGSREKFQAVGDFCMLSGELFWFKLMKYVVIIKVILCGWLDPKIWLLRVVRDVKSAVRTASNRNPNRFFTILKLQFGLWCQANCDLGWVFIICKPKPYQNPQFYMVLRKN